MDEDRLKAIRDDYESLIQKALERERRVFPRVSETVPLTLKGRKTSAHLFSMDIGLGGIRLMWNEPLSVGEIYEISVALDTVKAWVHVRSQVIWQRPHDDQYEIGMKFVEVDENLRKQLEAYMVALQRLVQSRGSQMETVEEKRRFPRVPRIFLVLIETVDPPQETLSGLIVDISLGGARLLTSRNIPEGKMLNIHVELEESRKVSLMGRVVWSNHVEALKKFQHGIEFVHAVEFQEYSSEVKELLEGVVSYQNSLKEINLVQTLLEIMREKRKDPG